MQVAYNQSRKVHVTIALLYIKAATAAAATTTADLIKIPERVAGGGRGKGAGIKSGEILERGYRETPFSFPRRGGPVFRRPRGCSSRRANPFETRTSLHLHARAVQHALLFLSSLSLSLSLSPRSPSSSSSRSDQVKRDVTSRHYCEQRATPVGTAARRFLTRPKATARQLNLIPVRLGLLPRGVRDEV